MKKNTSKRNFSKFNKRNIHKRKSKAKSVNELMSMVEASGVSHSGAHFRDVMDGGRRGRISHSPHRDEIRATGVFRGSRSGFGFVELDGADYDIFIPEDKTLGAIDGDTVDVIYHTYTNRYGENKTEGRVIKIVEFGRRTVIGTLVRERRGRGKRATYVYVLEPDDAKIAMRIQVADAADAEDGDKVEARLLRSARFVDAKVIRSFGAAESFGANYDAVLAECGIEADFLPEVLSEARRVSAVPTKSDGRLDLRDETIFTIDGAGAKDLDDAISLRLLPGGGYKLGVHIADVSAYVAEKTPLERAAMARGTSVYFADKVVPMLPPELSNGCCSLNAGEDKYAISAMMKLSAAGEITSVEIAPTIIRSCVRGVYFEVNAILDGSAGKALRDKYKRVIPTLNKMHGLYKILADRAVKRGALELEGTEAHIVLDENGTPVDIIRSERGDGEKMIEQFMLAANEAVATKLFSEQIPCVYRIHEEPPIDKLEALTNYLHNLGFDTRGIVKEGKVSISRLSEILDEARARGLAKPVSYSTLRAMSKAKYSEERHPHFGLGISTYCHFTSPIRRLSDLATHRIIRKVIFEGKSSRAYASYARRAAAAATECELRALTAERRIEDLYKAVYLSSRIGEEFCATVSSVTAFGMFCELENTCEGLVPISDMGDAFVFDEKNLTIRGGNAIYHLGDTVRVRVEECDTVRGKVRFSLTEDEDA